MQFKLKVSPASIIAVMFLISGGAQPASQFLRSIFPATKEIAVACSDLQDTEESEDAMDGEEDGENEVAKIVANRMILFSFRGVIEQAFTAYLLVFKEHHPDVVTPPPKG